MSHADRTGTPLRSKLLNPYRALAVRVAQQPFLQPALRRFWKKGRLIIGTREYQEWIRRRESSLWDGNAMRASARSFVYAPKISIVMPVYDTRPQWLQRAIESVRSQAYENWELCVCDDASTDARLRALLEQWRRADPRIKVAYSRQNGGISRASNRALQLATGEFVGLLDHDDELAPAALFEVVKLLRQHPEADLIYSDEDKLDGAGRRCDPFFKPDWSPEYLLSCNYICHFGVYRKALVDAVGGFRSEFDGSQDYDLILRICDRSSKIFHIPRVLYHWRESPRSTASLSAAKQHCAQAGREALRQHAQRAGMQAEIEYGNQPGRYRIRPRIQGTPLVSIILRSQGDIALLERCLAALEGRTAYPNYDVLIVGAGTINDEALASLRRDRIEVVRPDEKCADGRANNLGARQARGDYLLLLDSRCEALSPDWLAGMLELCQLDGIGVVGAKLCYPNRTIEHAGVIVGPGGVAVYSHQHLPLQSRGYFDSLICIRNCSAVVSACMMVRREAFGAAGGFDDRLKAPFNGIDFCLRVREKGWRVAWTPCAELLHRQSPDCGHGGEAADRELMAERWGALPGDPYYNPNLSLQHKTFTLNFEAS
jgi:GT2 family glycosyltransferase